MSKFIRQFHRWTSIAFTLGVIVNTAIIFSSGAQPEYWVYFLALIPLFLLLATGLYLFALPYVVKARRA